MAKQDSESRTWAMLCHLSALAQFIGVPFGFLLGPLVFWLIKRNDSPLVDQEGKKALNFQLTVFIAFLACIPLILILVGIFLIMMLVVLDAIFVIIASIKISNGEAFEYPFSIKFIS
jgi:hypothetical protein